MTATHAQAGDVIPLATAADDAKSATLIRESHAEVFRLVLAKGKHLSEHQAAGAITIQCLSGEINLAALGDTKRIRAGDLVYLGDHEPHAITAKEDSVLLVSVWLNRL